MSFSQVNLKAVENGPRHAVLYARVSSKEQELGYSIAAQQQLLRPYGARNDLVIEEEFIDVETARKPGRPGFEAMLTYLRRNRGCRVILVEKTDRLSRNLRDVATVEELDVEVHLVKTNRVISAASGADDKYRNGLDVLDAKRYVDNLSEEVKKGMRTKAAQGLWPSYAPLGYRNSMGDDGKRIITPHPELGPVVTDLYENFATGEYSLKRLADKAYAEGLRFRKSRGRVPVSTLHKILRNRLYMGEFDYAGLRHQGSHEPLVTREIWERAQEILDGRHQKKHRKVTHEFAYSGMVACGNCGCSLVGEVKKGRYVYYHCTGYRGKCGEPYTRTEVLERQFAMGLREISLPPEILRWLEGELLEAEKTARAAGAQVLRRHQAELERLQRRQEVMYDDRLDGRIDAATYDHKITQIHEQQEQVQRQVRAAAAGLDVPTNQEVDLQTVARQAGERFLEQTAAEQRKLLRVVLKGASWKRGELQIVLREPFETLRAAKFATAQTLPSRAGEELTPATATEVHVPVASLGDTSSFSEEDTGPDAAEQR